MNFLLDVNVLVAWGWDDHPNHDRVITWVHEAHSRKADMLLTSTIPQMGFVRVSVQRLPATVTPESAGQTLKRMLTWLGAKHRFLPDDQTSFTWPAWCASVSRTTDAHLLALAQAHGARLVTLDTRIPGAFVIP